MGGRWFVAGAVTAVQGVLRRAGAGPAVIAAFDRRAVALEHGLQAVSRPMDVAAVAGAARPFDRHGLSAADSKRFRRLVAAAIEGLDVRVQTNMWSSEAQRILREGGRLRTVHDAVGVPDAERLFGGGAASASIGRAMRELDGGFFGSGTTIYGTVQFGTISHAPTADIARGARLVRRERVLNTGSPIYGDASVVLGASVLPRTTFLPADTGMMRPGAPLGATEHLADVAAEAVLRHFHAGELRSSAESSVQAFGGDVIEHRALARSIRDLIDLPDDRAVARIRHHLTSTALGTDYIEAQVRWADDADIAAIHVRRPGLWDIRDDVVRTRFMGMQDDLRAVAAPRNVIVRYSDEALARTA